MDHRWEPSRSAALAQMKAFVRERGAQYGTTRNFVEPRGEHHNVSRLSPYLRYRAITEQELVAETLEVLGPQQGRSLIDEVLWRSYWKAHLWSYPSIHLNYLEELQGRLSYSSESLARAVSGETRWACFNDWTQELVETGYIHNHARMWWASIWIFTLGLPWQLGAEFFMQHLLDADPASNTLSWRWVAGLHTPNKLYVASEQNIHTFTRGRYPQACGLHTSPPVPDYTRGSPEPSPLAEWLDPTMTPHEGRTGLLVMAHDLHPESQWHQAPGPVAIWDPSSPPHTPAARFRQGLMQDAAMRLRAWSPASCPSHFPDRASVLAWALDQQLECVQLSTPPVAQAREIPALARELGAQGIALQLCTRAWDAQNRPFGERGYFRFRKKAGPQLLALAERAANLHAASRAGKEDASGRVTLE